MTVTLNLTYDDFTAHTCLFLTTKDISLRTDSSTHNVYMFDPRVITQSFSQSLNRIKFDNSATSE
jgi:hypothetical protein